jgi:hypothetical protein
MVGDTSNFELSKEECAKLVEYRDKKRLAQLAALKNPFAAKMHQAFGVPISPSITSKSQGLNMMISVIVVMLCLVVSVGVFLYLNQGALFGTTRISNTALPQENGSPQVQQPGANSGKATGTANQADSQTSSDSKDGIPNANVPSTKLSNAVYRDLLKYFDASNLESIKATDRVPKDVALYMSKILSFSDQAAGEVAVKLSYNDTEVSSSTMSNVAAMIYAAVTDANPELKRIVVTTSDGVISAVYPE